MNSQKQNIQNSKTLVFQHLEVAEKTAFCFPRSIEQTIVYKTRRPRALYDFPVKSYKHHNIPKNVKFMRKLRKNCIFWIFMMLITFDRKVVQSSGTSHFVDNRLLYRSRETKCRFFRDFEVLKNQGFAILDVLFLGIHRLSSFYHILIGNSFLYPNHYLEFF